MALLLSAGVGVDSVARCGMVRLQRVTLTLNAAALLRIAAAAAAFPSLVHYAALQPHAHASHTCMKQRERERQDDDARGSQGPVERTHREICKNLIF